MWQWTFLITGLHKDVTSWSLIQPNPPQPTKVVILRPNPIQPNPTHEWTQPTSSAYSRYKSSASGGLARGHCVRIASTKLLSVDPGQYWDRRLTVRGHTVLICTSHSDQLSLLPCAGRELSTGQRRVAVHYGCEGNGACRFGVTDSVAYPFMDSLAEGKDMNTWVLSS